MVPEQAAPKTTAKPKRSRAARLPADPAVEPLPEAPSAHHYLVGIGASAGGLEALTSLIAALPVDLGVSYVVMQHLSPTHRSLMVQLLGRETALVVQEVSDGVQPQPDTIYVAPATHNVVLSEGRLRLIETRRDGSPKPSANAFFSSLAVAKGEDAIGVVLSGTGSDGTVGMREIKAAGGFTFAQSPESAKYVGMPQSAIESGCVDWVLAPDAIAKEIAMLVRGQHRPLAPVASPQSASATLKRLLMQVKQKSRIDFSGYKENTLWRRIERRMAACHISTLDAYLQHVGRCPEELDRLAKDILISVTAFFRDPDAFGRLHEVLRTIVAGKQLGDEIRIWVAGCATGEEAYSIAILLSEVLGSDAGLYKIQIFATDIDNEAMNVARKGVYVEGALAEFDVELRKRYFTIQRGRYEISRALRDMVVFARQDLVLDPPFLRLDLISCRNVLIYLKSELQSKILATFHYGLKSGGYLFLGKSEGVFQQDNLFEPVDKNLRLYLRPAGDSQVALSYSRLPELRPVGDSRRNSAEQRLLDAAMRQYLPPSVLVNGNFDVLHIHGNVSDVLGVASGRPSLNLQHMIRRELRTDLQLLHHQAEKTLTSAYGRARKIGSGQSARHIRLAVHPTDPGVATQQFLVCFEPMLLAAEVALSAEAAPLSYEPRPDLHTLEDELLSTRERLQTVIEELETSNEELQALNEEVQAANEELQSSNEELEAANEELQSTNEELTTVNEELQIRTAELAETLANLEHIQNSVGFPILVLTQDLRLQRYNSPAAAVFALTAQAVGQNLGAFRMPPGMADWSGLVQQALEGMQAQEQAVFSAQRHYQLRVTPCGDAGNHKRYAVVTLVDDTERLEQERQLRISQERLLSIMNHSTSMITLKDLSGRYQFANRRFEELFGLAPEEAVGKTDAMLFPGRLADQFRNRELDALRSNKALENEDQFYWNDKEVYLQTVRFALRDVDNVAYAICTQATDVTDRVRAEHQLRLAARVFDRSSEGIMVTDPELKILTVNNAFTSVTGYAPEEAIGQTPTLLGSGRHGSDFYREMWEQIVRQGWWQGEIWNQRKSGDIYPEWLTINTVYDKDGAILNYVGVFSDISVVKDSQRRVEFLATHDALTALPNRTLFLDRIRQSIARAERSQFGFAILFLDLDNFKIVNDSLGHDAGDDLLCQVAQRLRVGLRAADTVARFGGDEFAILLEGADYHEADTSAARLIEALSLPIMVLGHPVHVGVSIGISMYPQDGADAQTLLKSADTAMYQAKGSGKGMRMFFTPELRQRADERMYIESGLRLAIDQGQLLLHYQPQVDLVSGAVIGVEALVRWQHPEQGLIAPARFIEIAEKSALIDKLGAWVLNEAFRQLSVWLASGRPIQQMSINISAEQFRRSDLVALVQERLQHYHLPAQLIMLEITEGALIQDNARVLQVLTELERLQVRLSIDDFGTGYSSLAYLRRFPIHELKIDRSFIDEVTENGDDQAITRTILSMASCLNLSTVAEGVETRAQAELLASFHCPVGQGYFFAKPMPADQVADLLGQTLYA